MAYVIIDPFLATSSNNILELFHTEQYANEFLQRRLAEDEDGWHGCIVKVIADNIVNPAAYWRR